MATKKISHKLGANQKEAAHTARPKDNNFAQSRDVREDRGERKLKTGVGARTFAHLPKAK